MTRQFWWRRSASLAFHASLRPGPRSEHFPPLSTLNVNGKRLLSHFPPLSLGIKLDRLKNMESESFDNWKLCWDINTLFHLARYSGGSYKCLWCKKTRDVEVPGSSWSWFLLIASYCPAKHVQDDSGERDIQPGVCPECEVDLVQRITERRQQCNVDGCRRYICVDEGVVQRTVGEHSITKK
jgi:hypothetical protein